MNYCTEKGPKIKQSCCTADLLPSTAKTEHKWDKIKFTLEKRLETFNLTLEVVRFGEQQTNPLDVEASNKLKAHKNCFLYFQWMFSSVSLYNQRSDHWGVMFLKNSQSSNIEPNPHINVHAKITLNLRG